MTSETFKANEVDCHIFHMSIEHYRNFRNQPKRIKVFFWPQSIYRRT